jgi:ABC-type transporter Mla subunit MlaD
MLLRNSASPFPAFQGRSFLFLLSGLALLLGVLVLWGYRLGWFQPSLRVSLISGSSLGLLPGTPVRVSGLHVGVIDAVDLLADGRVRLNLKIDDRFRPWVTPRSQAFLVRPSLLGSGGVDITPAPMQGRRHHDHFTITAQNTADLESFLAGAATTQADLQSLIRSTHRIASRELPHTIQELAAVLASVNQVGATVNQALPATVQELHGTLRQGQQSTQLFQRELPPTLAQVRDTLGVFRRTGGSVDQVAAQSQLSLEELMALLRRLNRVVSRIDTILDTLMPAEDPSGAGKPGADLPPAPAENHRQDASSGQSRADRQPITSSESPSRTPVPQPSGR